MNTHGTFEKVSRVESKDLEGYQISDEELSSSSATPKQSFKYGLLALPIIAILCGVAIVTKGALPSNPVTKFAADGAKMIPSYQAKVIMPTGDLKITAKNEYGQYAGQYPFFEEFPGSQLVEPFKATTITVSGPQAKSTHSFMWMLDGEEMPLSGKTVTVNLQSAGLFKLEVHVYNEKDEYMATFKTTLISKYVKRELRTLTVADREKFLDAAHKIWSVGTDEGRKQYGSKFTGIHTYVKEHATASEDIMCDQFHEGSGFITHHLALSNSFEAALRAVDPSVTMPYWDFSIDGQMIADADEIPSYLRKISPVFTADWFGSVDSNDHIQDSRWAHSKMPGVGHDDPASTPHNSFGYFRSYWNNNNDPEVVRHMFDICGVEDTQKKIPSCTTHFAVMNATNLAHFQTLSPGDGHGPLHVQTGGVFGGCTEAYANFKAKWGTYLDTDVTEAEMLAGGYTVEKFTNKWGDTGHRRTMFDKAIMGEWFHIYRGMWRSHMCAVDGASALMECPESCDSTQSFEECTCQVNKLTTGETDWKNLYPCLLNSAENRGYFQAAFSEEFIEETTKLVATSPTKEGEMVHSGSPADIMFWIIHPVIERMLAAKRVSTVNMMGDQHFVKWGQEMETDSSNWLSWSYYNLEAGANKFHPEAYTCTGHAADDWALPDKLPYTGVMMNADKNGDGHISNWEFLGALDPNNVHANDYVFDNFEWSHCDGKIGQAVAMGR